MSKSYRCFLAGDDEQCEQVDGAKAAEFEERASEIQNHNKLLQDVSRPSCYFPLHPLCLLLALDFNMDPTSRTTFVQMQNIIFLSESEIRLPGELLACIPIRNGLVRCQEEDLHTQENERLRARLGEMQSHPSPLEAATAKRDEHVLDQEKFRKLIDNLQVFQLLRIQAFWNSHSHRASLQFQQPSISLYSKR